MALTPIQPPHNALGTLSLLVSPAHPVAPQDVLPLDIGADSAVRLHAKGEGPFAATVAENSTERVVEMRASLPPEAVDTATFRAGSQSRFPREGVRNIIFAPNESPDDIFSALFPQHGPHRKPFSEEAFDAYIGQLSHVVLQALFLDAQEEVADPTVQLAIRVGGEGISADGKLASWIQYSGFDSEEYYLPDMSILGNQELLHRSPSTNWPTIERFPGVAVRALLIAEGDTSGRCSVVPFVPREAAGIAVANLVQALEEGAGIVASFLMNQLESRLAHHLAHQTEASSIVFEDSLRVWLRENVSYSVRSVFSTTTGEQCVVADVEGANLKPLTGVDALRIAVTVGERPEHVIGITSFSAKPLSPEERHAG